MTKLIDYSTVAIPSEKTDRKDLTFRQRRAELLKIILRQGHTDLSTVLLSERYGISPAQITHDKKVLIQFLAENYFKPNKIKSDAVTAKTWALKRAIAAGDHKTVNQISNDLLEMGFSLGIIDKTPDKIDVEDSINITWGETPPENLGSPKKTKKQDKCNDEPK